MKMIMALDVRGADYLDAQLAFHLNAGVDLVVVTGAEHDDGVSEVLEPHIRQGHVVRAGEQARSPMTAEIAAVEHAGDWLITSAPNEFWWPRGASLKDVLLAIPPRYGVVQALVRHFRPSSDGGFFAERMAVRESLASASAGPEPLLHLLRSIQRLVPGVGADPGQPLRAWYPVEVFQFPNDTSSQGEDLDVDGLSRGLKSGALVVDERLRDALRLLQTGSGYRVPIHKQGALAFPVPTVVEDATFAVECAAVGEVDLDRLDRQIRELEERIAWLEERFWSRVTRRLSRYGRPG